MNTPRKNRKIFTYLLCAKLFYFALFLDSCNRKKIHKSDFQITNNGQNCKHSLHNLRFPCLSSGSDDILKEKFLKPQHFFQDQRSVLIVFLLNVEESSTPHERWLRFSVFLGNAKVKKYKSLNQWHHAVRREFHKCFILLKCSFY